MSERVAGPNGQEFLIHDGKAFLIVADPEGRSRPTEAVAHPTYKPTIQGAITDCLRPAGRLDIDALAAAVEKRFGFTSVQTKNNLRHMANSGQVSISRVHNDATWVGPRDRATPRDRAEQPQPQPQPQPQHRHAAPVARLRQKLGMTQWLRDNLVADAVLPWEALMPKFQADKGVRLRKNWLRMLTTSAEFAVDCEAETICYIPGKSPQNNT